MVWWSHGTTWRGRYEGPPLLMYMFLETDLLLGDRLWAEILAMDEEKISVTHNFLLLGDLHS